MPARFLLYFVFACSGAAALIYEITWTRLLALLLGHTTAAASTVLAAFMGGLALGALLAGRRVGALTRPLALRAYAGLEVLVAVLALLLPFAVGALQPVLRTVYADGDGGVLFVLVRLCGALLIILVPATALGATLPLVVRWLAVTADRAGRETARLYAANTIGATVGAVAAGFLLLPSLGMRGATLVAVALNVAAAAASFWMAGTDQPAPSAPTPPRKPHGPVRTRRGQPPSAEGIAGDPARLRWAAVIAVALSGGASLILQVAWARILALAIGPTTYAFSAMVATFIAGIALGSLAVGAAVRRRASPRLLAIVLLLGAVAASAAAAWVPRIPLIVADAVAASSSGFETIFRLQVVIIVLLMVPMTMAAGAVLPLAAGLAAQRDDSVPRDVALVYTANTLGAIGGALAGGFLLVPILGLHGTIRIAALLGIVASGVVWSAAGGRRRLMVAGLTAAVAAVWLTPSWDRELLSSGAYKYAAYLPHGEREPLLRAGTLHYYREGAVATVSVREVTGTLSLAIDGKIDASNAGDMLTQRLLAHLPLLLHPAPDRVGIIGLGSGVTLGSALRHPVSRAEAIEISPEVVEASAFFRRENHDALADPRSRLVVGDGRSHLLLGRTPYDVLISEPSNPWMAGIAALFTREFFDAARRRLRPGGLFCQWAHTYDMSAEDLRSIVATFASAFPETSLWLIGDADVLLVGGAEPLEARLDHVPRAWERPGVRDDLDGVGVTSPAALLSLFVASTRELQAYAAGAAIQRDDRMALEFTGPRQLYRPRGVENVTVLRALADSAPAPPVIADARSRVDALIPRGAMLLRAEAFDPAFAAYARAIEHGPLDPDGVDGLLRSAAAAGKASEAEALLRRLRDRRPDDVSIALALSRVLAGEGKFEAAAAVFAAAPPEWRADPRVLEQLASVFADAGDQSLLSTSLRDLERIAPDGEAALYYRAVREFSTGRAVEAQRLAERLAGRHGHAFRARAFTLLGAVHATAGRVMEARDAFLAAARADPRDPVPYENLGALALQRGDAESAIDAFAQALILNPDSAAARQGLAQASAIRHPRM